MKRIGKQIVLVCVLLLIVVWVPGAGASTFYNVDPVAFYAVDYYQGSGSAGKVTLVSQALGDATGYTLQYRYDGITGWQDWTSGAEKDITVSPGESELVKLRLLYDTSAYITRADLTYSGEGPTGLFSTLIVDWDGISSSVQFDIISATECDKVAPVPISNTLLLLMSGIIGLVGIGRKFRR